MSSGDDKHKGRVTEAKSPAEREAESSGTVTIEFDGHSYALPDSMDDWDYTAIEAFENGRAVTFLRAILEPEDAKRFFRSRPKGRDLKRFTDSYAEALGIDTGK